MITEADVHEYVRKSVEALKSLKNQGKIDENSYYKMIVCVSSEYIAQHMFDEAADLIRTIPSTYFEKEQREQMLEDEEYATVAVSIAKKLHDAGKVDFNEEPRFTQSGAGEA